NRPRKCLVITITYAVRGLHIVHKRSSAAHRAAQVNDVSVQPMQGAKDRLGAKTFLDRDRAQFLREWSSAAKAENRIHRSANPWPRAKSFGHHAGCARCRANIERLPFGEAIAKRGHHERSLAADCGLDGFNQKIQPLLIRHVGELCSHDRIWMYQNNASLRNAY